MGKLSGVYVWRLRDAKDLMGLNRKKVRAFPVPSDFLVARSGSLEFAEVKSTFELNRFPFKNIEPGQRSAAAIATICDAPYSFYIKQMDTNKWYKMSGSQFVAAIKSGQKSIPFDELPPWTFS